MIANNGADKDSVSGNDPSQALPWGRTLPKNVLVPWVLLLLKQWSAHGYSLLQTLQQMGVATVDHATLYKELRNLEKQGFITSTWTTDGNGPARRMYEITEAGEELLRASAGFVAAHQRLLAGFSDLYADVMGWPAAAPNASGRKPTAKQSSRKQKGGGKGNE